MNIALDYDDTYTADPELWNNFVADAQKRGHRVFIVTARYPESVIDDVPGIPRSRHIYTSMMAKRFYCLHKYGLQFSIWIDDKPEYVTHGV